MWLDQTLEDTVNPIPEISFVCMYLQAVDISNIKWINWNSDLHVCKKKIHPSDESTGKCTM